jgi:molybdenum cofactor cytidylyltransferase
MNQKVLQNNLSAIILAAGQSGRMAPENKLLLPFPQKTIIQKVLDEIVPLNFTQILVVIGFEKDKLMEVLKDYPARFYFNPYYNRGMSTSIQVGISQTKPDIDGYMIFLGDMPWIDQNLLKTLIQTFYTGPESAIVVPAFKKRQGNPVIFSKKYKKELLSLKGDRGARSVIKKFPDRIIEVQIQNERLLLDIDTWEDFEIKK